MIPTSINVYNGHFIFESNFASMLIHNCSDLPCCQRQRKVVHPFVHPICLIRLRIPSCGCASWVTSLSAVKMAMMRMVSLMRHEHYLRTDTSVNISRQGPILSSKVAKRPRNPSNRDSSEQSALLNPNCLS